MPAVCSFAAPQRPVSPFVVLCCADTYLKTGNNDTTYSAYSWTIEIINSVLIVPFFRPFYLILGVQRPPASPLRLPPAK